MDGELGEAAGRLLSSAGDVEAALAAIEDVAALARRPDAQVDAVTHYLCRFIQAWHELSQDPARRVTTCADGAGFSISPPTEWVTVPAEPGIAGPAAPPEPAAPETGRWEPVICGPGGEAEADTVLSGRYRLDQLVGRGTLATVWRARDLLLDREVAVKWLLNWDYGRLSHQLFGHEAQIMAKLRHPGIVAVYDTGVDGGWPYIVMELLLGGDLSQLMSFYGQGLPVRRAVDLAIQLADAVAAIHERDVVHCGLSTQNVFVQEGDEVKVIDFAIAQDRGAEPAPPPDGYVMGAPEYMAPELFDSAGPAYTVSSDLYALGCVLYEMLTGAPPFTSDSGFPGYIRQHVEEAPAPPRDRDPAIPEALNDLVLTLLLKAPADRPGSAADVAAALRDIQASLPGPGELHLA